MNLKQGYSIVDSRKGGEVRKKSKISDMAVRGKGAIDRNREGSFNEFYGNHPELNKLLDADSQLRKDAIDFFDTINYLIESGYRDWVDETIDGLLNEYPFGCHLVDRYFIFRLKNKLEGGTTRVFYFPDRGVINIEGNDYLEIGGNSNKKANARFMETYNNFDTQEGIDEVVADVTASFFASEKEEFGSSEIEDSVRVSDMAIRDMAIYNKSGIEASAARRNSEFETANAHLSSIFGLKQKAIDCFETMHYIRDNGYVSELNDELLNLRRATGVEPVDSSKSIQIVSEKGYSLVYKPYTSELYCGDGLYSKQATNLQKSEFMKNYNNSEFANKPYDMVSWFFEDFFQWVNDMFGTDEVVQDSAKSQGENKSDKIADNFDDKSYYQVYMYAHRQGVFNNAQEAIEFAKGISETDEPVCVLQSNVLWKNELWNDNLLFE